MLFHGHKRDVDKERHLKRLHKTTPFIESPLTGADHDHLVFSQRHEASTVELFFDLFFVANLATFTTYHSISDGDYLLAYVGFFGILWSCWFQVTLHDVRFARDSIYERVCKTIQFIVFVGLALVGSGFTPGKVGMKGGSNTNFRILCYTLVISRGLLVVQYLVVLFYTVRAGFAKLYLPIGLMVGIYAVGAGAFGAMTPAFRAEDETNRSFYVVWYIIMLLEAVGVIAISCFWRMLSFKKTHLMERMSLLTLIVIGEGAIGATKTVSRLMGKSGLEVEGCFLIMCIIVLLVLLWANYFDHFPHGHYGTIRQQIWSLLHFPLQLGIVGVVEGAQQVVLARYVMENWAKVESSISKYCIEDNLDGAELRDALIKLVKYWNFDKKMETQSITKEALNYVYAVGNTTGICSEANAEKYEDTNQYPADLVDMIMTMFDGVYKGLGMKIPTDKLEKASAAQVATQSWKLVYLYFWTSFCTVIVCSVLFLILIRRHKTDVFDYVSIITRVIALGLGAALIGLVASEQALYMFLSTPMVLPTVLIMLFLILCGDKISAVYCNRRLQKSGQLYAKEWEEEHHGSGQPHMHDGSRDDSVPLIQHHGNEANRKSWAHATTVYDKDDVSTAYTPGSEGFALSPMPSPLVSPPARSPDPILGGGARGRYEPVRGA